MRGAPQITLQIQAGHFTAGLTLGFKDERGGYVVTRRAPILHYMQNWSETKVREYCRKQKWTVRTVG